MFFLTHFESKITIIYESKKVSEISCAHLAWQESSKIANSSYKINMKK